MRPWKRSTVCKYLGRGTLAHTRAHTRTQARPRKKGGCGWLGGVRQEGGYLRCEPNLSSLIASQTKRPAVQYLVSLLSLLGECCCGVGKGATALVRVEKTRRSRCSYSGMCTRCTQMRWLAALVVATYVCDPPPAAAHASGLSLCRASGTGNWTWCLRLKAELAGSSGHARRDGMTFSLAARAPCERATSWGGRWLRCVDGGAGPGTA